MGSSRESCLVLPLRVCGLKNMCRPVGASETEKRQKRIAQNPKFHSQYSLLAGSVAASMTASYLYDSITIVVLRAQLYRNG